MREVHLRLNICIEEFDLTCANNSANENKIFGNVLPFHGFLAERMKLKGKSSNETNELIREGRSN